MNSPPAVYPLRRFKDLRIAVRPTPLNIQRKQRKFIRKRKGRHHLPHRRIIPGIQQFEQRQCEFDLLGPDGPFDDRQRITVQQFRVHAAALPLYPFL